MPNMAMNHSRQTASLIIVGLESDTKELVEGAQQYKLTAKQRERVAAIIKQLEGVVHA